MFNIFYDIRALHKQHTCTTHSQCVNTGHCREVQQVERRVTVKAMCTWCWPQQAETFSTYKQMVCLYQNCVNWIIIINIVLHTVWCYSILFFMTPYILVEICRCFREMFCLHFQGQRVSWVNKQTACCLLICLTLEMETVYSPKHWQMSARRHGFLFLLYLWSCCNCFCGPLLSWVAVVCRCICV
jgi:hypothetical protein